MLAALAAPTPNRVREYLSENVDGDIIDAPANPTKDWRGIAIKRKHYSVILPN
jgi:hypothetical protein